jgi:hypothetical protein
MNSLVLTVIRIKSISWLWLRRRFLDLARTDPHSAMAIHASYPDFDLFALSADIGKGCDRCTPSSIDSK